MNTNREKNSFDTDVLIVGAGPVGLTLGSELLRYGATVRIVDKAAGTKEISKALILHVRTQEVQYFMGVLPASQAEAKPLKQIEVHAYGKHIGSIREVVESPYPNALILGQNRTEHILQEHLQNLGGKVEWKTEGVRFTQDESGVMTTLRREDGTEETIRSRSIAGCEGSNSMVRKGLNLAFEGERYTGEQFIQADCKIRWSLPTGISHLFLTKEGYMMVIEMPNDIVRVFISLPDNQPAPDPNAREESLRNNEGVADNSQPTLAEIQTALNELGFVDAELSDPVWLARYRTSHRAAPQFRVGRAFIAGDAGHVHVPLGGQGMNTGIQDAFNLGWKLGYVLRGWAKPELLDSYQAERHPVAESLLHGTDEGYRRILHPNQRLQQMVRRFGPFVVRQQAVQSSIQSILEEIKIAYSESPLREDHGGGGIGGHGVGAGERAPDAIVVRLSDKQTVRLFDIMHGTKWTLLLLTGRDPSLESNQRVLDSYSRLTKTHPQIETYLVATEPLPDTVEIAADKILMDRSHFLHDTYGASKPTLYLLRPDDYVGFRGRNEDVNHLEAYIERIFSQESP